MRAPYNFIVEPLEGKRYNNTKKVAGIDLVTSTSEENHFAANRYAKVVATPIYYNGNIKKGDTLLVHHNVFKYYNDMKGRQKSGRSYFQDNLFFIENDQFYMYKQNGEWFCHDRYCFVKPVEKQESYLVKNYKEEPLVGTMKYLNNYLLKQKVRKGDKIIFQPESEYEFVVDGEKLYRMYDHQITVVLNEV